MEPGRRHLAERRLVAALRRLHRRDPLKPDLRIDAVLAELRTDPGERLPPGHRGGGTLRDVGDAELIGLLEALADSGKVAVSGHRVRLAGHEPVIGDTQMRERVERLLAGLRETGAEPPRVEGVAARLGIAPGVVDQLRSAGELVAIGDGIDYPRDILADLLRRMSEIGRHGALTVPRVRDGLRTSRRHAEALLAYRRSTMRQRRCPIRRR
jgi:hypothetical protein